MLIKRKFDSGNSTHNLTTYPAIDSALHNSFKTGDMIFIKGPSDLVGKLYVKTMPHTQTNDGLVPVSMDVTPTFSYEVKTEQEIDVFLEDNAYRIPLSYKPSGSIINNLALVLLSDGTTIEVGDIAVQAVTNSNKPHHYEAVFQATDTVELEALGISKVTLSYLYKLE